jgi:mono/diheme cytochrome c family protein
MKRALAPLLACLVLGVGCGSGRRDEPLVGPLPQLTAEQARGEQMYFKHCHSCHPGGDAGLGPAITNKPVPLAAISLQVRKGLGAMPSFSDSELGEADLDAILAYIDLLSDHGD